MSLNIRGIYNENKTILSFTCVTSNSFTAWEMTHILKCEFNWEFHISYQPTCYLPKSRLTLHTLVSPTLRPSRAFLLTGLLRGWGSCLSYYAGTPWIAYALLCCPFQEILGWSPPWAPGPVNVEGLTHMFFLSRWPIADTSCNVTFACLLLMMMLVYHPSLGRALCITAVHS